MSVKALDHVGILTYEWLGSKHTILWPSRQRGVIK